MLSTLTDPQIKHSDKLHCVIESDSLVELVSLARLIAISSPGAALTSIPIRKKGDQEVVETSGFLY